MRRRIFTGIISVDIQKLHKVEDDIVKRNQKTKKDKFDIKRCASSNDCTGLITVPPGNEDELENYHDVYDFGPIPGGKVGDEESHR